jgi:hypothetical protein
MASSYCLLFDVSSGTTVKVPTPSSTAITTTTWKLPRHPPVQAQSMICVVDYGLQQRINEREALAHQARVIAYREKMARRLV